MSSQQRRADRGQHNFIMLGVMLALMFGLGVYGLFFFKSLQVKNARYRMEALEKQERDHAEQQAFFRTRGYRSASVSGFASAPAGR